MPAMLEPTQSPPTQDALSLLARRVLLRTARGTALQAYPTSTQVDVGYRQATKSPTKVVKGPYSASAAALAGVVSRAKKESAPNV